MNLDRFKAQIEKQGLAKSNRWVCSIFPPKSLSSIANSIDIPVGRFGNLNLPGIDLNNIPVALASIRTGDSNLPDVNIGANISLPVFGFTTVNNGTFVDRINLFCQQATIPEREIKNVEWREYGQSRNLGVMHMHKDFTISYYCSEDMRERTFFEQWQDIMFNSLNKRRAYYEDYISRIEVTKYDSGWNNEEATYRMYEAYPTNVASQTLVSEANSGVLRLDITFKYRYYERIK